MTEDNRKSTVESCNPDQEPAGDPRTQAEKFADLVRELECDEDEEAFKAKLVKVAKAPKTRGRAPESK